MCLTGGCAEKRAGWVGMVIGVCVLKGTLVGWVAGGIWIHGELPIFLSGHPTPPCT